MGTPLFPTLHSILTPNDFSPKLSQWTSETCEEEEHHEEKPHLDWEEDAVRAIQAYHRDQKGVLKWPQTHNSHHFKR